MKTLLLCSIVATFAFVTTLQAGDDKKASTCADQAKSSCGAKSSCCAEKVVKKADTSVKGATLLVRR